MTRNATPGLPAPAEAFVPHRPPMLLVSRLLEAGEGRGLAEARLDEDCPFIDQAGLFEPAGFVELGAQAYAAAKGLEFLRAGVPFQEGFLVGIQGARICGQARAGDTLFVSTQTMGEFEDFAVVRFEVRRAGETLAEGRIKLYAPECAGEGE